MPEDIGAAERMIDEWQNRAEERAGKFNAMREQIEQITVCESSRDGAIRVTVSSNGILRDLELSEQAAKRPMSALASEIMNNVRTAQSRIPELMQQAVADTVGTEDTAAQHVLGEARRTFPEPPTDDGPAAEAPRLREIDFTDEDELAEPAPSTPSRPAPSRRPAPPPDEDEDFSDDTFLR